MSSSLSVISVDIGNTRTHVGIVDVQTCVCYCTDAFPTSKLEEKLQDSITQLLASITLSMPEKATVSGVVGNAVTGAINVLRQMSCMVQVLDASISLPIALRYSKPETLGPDRIANALYAARCYPDDPVIIISAGSAIVIDYVVDHTFMGGVILPGIAMQLKSLHACTDRLPELSIPQSDEVLPICIPGTSTESCIIGGVLSGIAGAVKSIVDTYRSLAGKRKFMVLATGGDWSFLSRIVDFRYCQVPDMTLVGTALITSVKF